METVKLTHATLKREMFLTKTMIYAVWPADSFGGTYVLANGGAVAPVAETIDVVYPLVFGKSYPGPDKEGPKHVRKK